MTLVVNIAWVLLILWLLGAALTTLSLASQKFLKPSDDERLTRADAPFVSVLVPARNEEGRILADCVRSVLAQDYGSFEVVAVNDRSTDATGDILRRLAAGDERLRVVEGAETPAGWLGKPYALSQALAVARGEWVLTTDADVMLHTSALRTAVVSAQRHGADAVTFIPHYESRTFWERVFIPTWGWAMLIYFPPFLFNHPKYPMALGLGGFFLVRRDALERVGGFSCVRDEVVEDVQLAEKLKRSGARLRAEYAPALARTRMYESLREIRESAARVWFASARFSLALSAFIVVWMFSMGVVPPALAVVSAAMTASGRGGEWPQLLLLSASVWALHVLLLAAVSRRFGIPARYALTVPLGWLLNCSILLNSALAVKTGRGLAWKGRKVYARGGGVRPPGSKRGAGEA